MGDLRKIINNYEGTFAQQGAILWMFDKKGIIRINKEKIEDKENFELQVIDLGADDFKEEGDEIVVYTLPVNLEKVKEGIEKSGIEIDYAEIEWFAKDPITISEKQQEKINDIFAKLDEIGEINDYYTNIK